MIAHLSQTFPRIVVTHPLFAIWHSTHALHFGGILIEFWCGDCSFFLLGVRDILQFVFN